MLKANWTHIVPVFAHINHQYILDVVPCIVHSLGKSALLRAKCNEAVQACMRFEVSKDMCVLTNAESKNEPRGVF